VRGVESLRLRPDRGSLSQHARLLCRGLRRLHLYVAQVRAASSAISRRRGV